MFSRKGRIGLLYNQASVDSRFRSTPELINDLYAGRLSVLFGPQHGVGGTEQDNMKETGHGVHPTLGLPIMSLYSDKREPTSKMLDAADTFLVDIQDVGTRVYTFASTVIYLMRACSKAGKGVMILDRPNPINGLDVEGNLLDVQLASFVGPYPIPMRHGMTLGELLLFCNDVFEIGCSLDVVPMAGWSRNQWFEDTDLPWVIPSPNMPIVETAVVYPGQVMLEGSNLSEGRGTTRPFEIFGAPYLEPHRLAEAIEPGTLDGAVLRPVDFRPTFNKWGDLLCKGFQIHVTDRHIFRPYRASLAILAAVIKLYPDEFKWADPPYEYVFDQLPIDVILGDSRVRTDIEQARSVLEMEQEWLEDLEKFCKTREKFLLYSA
ncbi:MAG: DUF1343 domain-containing protein [Deltaproteobacteria bacterium]|nr:DUF1343 domain-containing protein [Deltaproteobacteria bacterium]